MHTKRALPHSLAVRGKRICTNQVDLAAYSDTITKAFVARGYPTNLVKNQVGRPQHVKDIEPVNCVVPLVTQWNPGLHILNGILKSGLNILKASRKTQDLIPNMPRVHFTRPMNLSNLMVRHDLTVIDKNITAHLPPGSYPCRKPRCKTCPMHTSTTTFGAQATGKIYPISHHNSCSSFDILYQLNCNICGAEYVGLTTNMLRIRMNGHRQASNDGLLDKPVAQHAASHGVSFNECYTVRVVKSFSEGVRPAELRLWELAYQFVTCSRVPPNLNIR